MGDDAEAPRLKAVPSGPEIDEHGLTPDQAWFGSEFRRLERDVFRVCRRMLDSSAAADDAVSEVYLRARRARRRH